MAISIQLIIVNVFAMSINVLDLLNNFIAVCACTTQFVLDLGEYLKVSFSSEIA